MSERGSFATELIFCVGCYAAVGRVLWNIPDERIRYQGIRSLPTIAGQWIGSVTATFPGGEIHFFWCEVIDKLEDVLCHPLRLVVFAENGDNVVYSLLPIAHIQATTPPNTIPIFPGKGSPRDWLGLAPGESLQFPLPVPSGLLQVENLVDDALIEGCFEPNEAVDGGHHG